MTPSDTSRAEEPELLDSAGLPVRGPAEPNPTILDETGSPLRSRGQSQSTTGDQVEAFISRQPLTALLVAAGLGYLIGRLG
jgi:hypothetical protein